jgi:hypothetical protein
MGTRAAFIAEARKSLGTGETPPGSNRNYIVTWYNKHVDPIGPGAWCDMAVTMWGALSGNGTTVGEFAYTVWHAEWYHKQGRFAFGTAGITAGQTVFFDWRGSRKIDYIDHVGIVERVEGSEIHTIEGNISGGYCKKVVRDSTYIVGYGKNNFAIAPLKVPSGSPMLIRGSMGTRVEALQKCLNKVLGSKLATDGNFGILTTLTLEAFQDKFHLVKDGEYGPKSATAMAKALAAIK